MSDHGQVDDIVEIAKALEIAAGRIDGMAVAAARINLFGHLVDAYQAAKFEVDQITKKIRTREEIEDRNGLKHRFGSNRDTEINRLRAKRDEHSDEADSYHKFWIEERDKRIAAEAQLASARKALEPFAAVDIPEACRDKLPILGIDRLIVGLTIGHLRAARSALTDDQGKP